MVNIPRHDLFYQFENEKIKRVLRPWVIEVGKALAYFLIFWFVLLLSGKIYVFKEKTLLKAATLQGERIKIEAMAEAEANRILHGTITEELLRYKEITKE